ncbi:NAD-dependent epimerase/dehydratase family protein [Polynucleobacter sp.]|uniref:NAD-dependent epimerase/dehydratase family protein n=1 Tax=Polynucleobacter sp. TaxID=2029855 RepID=UPI00333F3D6D
MKIWVTGASGSLGQELVRSLKATIPDAELLAPSRSEIDLGDRESVRNFVFTNKPTHVFHLAAKVFGIAGHKEQPAASLIENTLIDHSIFSALLEFPPRWVYYSSTVAAYGYPYKSIPIEENDWLIGNPHESEMGYAFSKRHSLSYLEMLHSISETKFVYGLSTNLFGSGDRFLEGRGHVVISLLEKATRIYNSSDPLEVWGDGTASRDFLSTKAAAGLLIDLVDKHVGIVNIASGQQIFIKEIANEIAEVFELDGGIEFVGINQGITSRVCSTEKLEKFTSFVKEINSKQELWGEIRNYKENRFPSHS